MGRILMRLPIFNSSLQEMSLLQTRWSSIINPVLSLPTNSGLILKNISLLSASSPNVVNHLLSRNLQGWMIIRQRSSASIYDTQDSNNTPNLTLQLITSANVTVDIFVF